MPGLRWLSVLATLVLAAAMPASAAWSPLGGPSVPSIEVQLHPGRPQLLYARAIVSEGPEGGYLWRSDDGGGTWRNLQRGLERPSSALAIDPTDPNVILVWTSDGQLWRSGDAGETWTRRFETPEDQITPQVVQLLVDPHRSETLFRVDFDGSGTRVSVTRDGGISFQAGALVPHFTGLDSIFPHPSRGELISFDEKGLEVSTDDGQSWSVRSAFGKNGFAAGRLAPSASDTLYAVPYDPAQCLARSDDAGAHWAALPNPPLPANSRCVDLAVDPKDARHVWAAAEGNAFGLFESRDGGNTWSAPRISPANGVVAAGGDVVYTGIATEPRGSGLYVSTDGGQTWQPRHRGIVAGDLRGGFVAQGLPDGSAGRRLVAPDRGIAGDLIGLFRSDGGKDWVKLPFQSNGAIDAGRPVLLAFSERGMVRSKDGGVTWSVVPSAPRGFGGLQSSLTQPRYVALETYKDVGDYGKVAFWTSDNGGVTWRQSSKGLPLFCRNYASVGWCPYYHSYAVDPFDPRRRWVAGGGLPFGPRFFLSEDAGTSWHTATQNSPWIFALAADPGAKDRLLAGTYGGGLLVSEDGGEHWQSFGDGLPENDWVRQLVWDARSATWYAATVSQGIYRSLDHGSTWTLLAGAPDHDAPTIAVDPRLPTALLAAFRGQGLWRWTP